VEEDLLDIRAGIKAGRYVNEATVSQGIVQRLLHALGWPVYDTEIVAPRSTHWEPGEPITLCAIPHESR
jgi:predicted type IV restriction endonuclease